MVRVLWLELGLGLGIGLELNLVFRVKTRVWGYCCCSGWW